MFFLALLKHWYMSFGKDLEFGREFERKALDYFEHTSYEFAPNRCFKDYDIKLDGKTTIEVKADRLAHKTGNVVIEYQCNGKPSGIESTRADFWLYFIDKTNEVYRFRPTEIKEFICKLNPRSVKGGDGYRSRMYIVPKKAMSNFLVHPVSCE